MNRQLHRFKQLLSIALIFCLLFVSCKKEETILPEQDKWSLIEAKWDNHDGIFHEADNGYITYRNDRHIYVFKPDGTLANQFQDLMTRYWSKDNFPLVRDGSIFANNRPPSNLGQLGIGDFLFWFQRYSNGSYDNVKMVDIRKMDSINQTYPKYAVISIQPDFIEPNINSNVWIYGVKSNFSAGYNIKYILIQRKFNNIEYELPEELVKDHNMMVGVNNIVFYRPKRNRSVVFNRNVQYIGLQNSFQILPNIRLLNDFVVISSNEFYTSVDGLTLNKIINGLPEDTEILNSRDSFLFIKSDIGYSTFNGITGQEVSRFNLRSPKMPVNIDSTYVIDYYQSRNGITYLITGRGIVVAK